MSCPYFEPLAPHGGPASETAMLPLGDRWTGVCHAAPDHPSSPGYDALASCNLGYARCSCPRFPPADGPDAVRFTIASAAESSLSLHYVLERDHHPYAHGRIDYLLPAGEFASLPFGATFAAQARAYVASYRRRKTAAAAC